MNKLIKTEKNGIISKIKKFFYSLWGNKNNEAKEIAKTAKTDNSFNDRIKIENTDSIEAVILQKRYRLGQVKEDELTPKQLQMICELYDKQIRELKIKKYTKLARTLK